MRRAFTLPEVLVAIIVFATAVIGLAGMGTLLAVQVREARDLSTAADLSGSVLDSLRAVPCTSAGSGQGSSGPVTARWTAAPSGQVVSVTMTVGIAGRRRPWQLTFESLLPCDR